MIQGLPSQIWMIIIQTSRRTEYFRPHLNRDGRSWRWRTNGDDELPPSAIAFLPLSRILLWHELLQSDKKRSRSEWLMIKRRGSHAIATKPQTQLQFRLCFQFSLESHVFLEFSASISDFKTLRETAGACIATMATTMTSLASSCSAFLEGESLRVRSSESQRRNSAKCMVQAKVSEGETMAAGGMVSRRQAAYALVAGALVLPVAPMAHALLEADDDDSLLEKVKEDKKKRIQKRATAINEFVKESEFVQVAVYKLSEAGQAIDGGDFSKATSVLSQQNADWIRDIQKALDKVSSNSDEKAVAGDFRSALSSLQAAVKSGDSSSSRTAFVASAEALDKWTRLTGLAEKVVGL